MRFDRKNNQGVALIFFALIFSIFLGTTMILLNTGQLVYQKIRLQAAVDLASYAGASVQASYLGNNSSGEDSIQAINQRIRSRYFDLLSDVQTYTAVWPTGFPDAVSCAVACQAANLQIGNEITLSYRRAAADIQQEHARARRILQQLPEATQQAIEQTLALNIPELALEQRNRREDALEVTNQATEVMGNDGRALISRRTKNAALSFSSNQGLYLSNVLGSVPHSFPIFGPACFPADTTTMSYWYCTVNGQGAPGDEVGIAMAAQAYARALAGGELSGNLGNIEDIGNLEANALRLHFVENPTKPKPFVVAAAEWYPKVGNSVNLENARNIGQGDRIFPERTRLVAISGAEPFGANLAQFRFQPFGVRLAGLRKLLLDPRVQPVRDDYGALFDYMQFVGPKSGDDQESAEAVIQRFLH